MPTRTGFSTQVPSFANDTQLSTLLEDHGVTINANNPDTGPSFLESLIFGFGPTLLIVGLLVFFDPAFGRGAGGAGGLMSFGRSRARRVEASEQPVTFADVAGIDEAKDELTEIVDFLKNPDKYLSARRPDPARRAAQRRAGNRQDAARARGRRRGGRRRSSRCRPRSSSR